MAEVRRRRGSFGGRLAAFLHSYFSITLTRRRRMPPPSNDFTTSTLLQESSLVLTKVRVKYRVDGEYVAKETERN